MLTVSEIKICQRNRNILLTIKIYDNPESVTAILFSVVFVYGFSVFLWCEGVLENARAHIKTARVKGDHADFRSSLILLRRFFADFQTGGRHGNEERQADKKKSWSLPNPWGGPLDIAAATILREDSAPRRPSAECWSRARAVAHNKH